MFHVQFAVLRKLDASMLNWPVEEVVSSKIGLMESDTKLFNELPFRTKRRVGDSRFDFDIRDGEGLF